MPDPTPDLTDDIHLSPCPICGQHALCNCVPDRWEEINNTEASHEPSSPQN